jgi:hypothetical protein
VHALAVLPRHDAEAVVLHGEEPAGVSIAARTITAFRSSIGLATLRKGSIPSPVPRTRHMAVAEDPYDFAPLAERGIPAARRYAGIAYRPSKPRPAELAHISNVPGACGVCS